MNLIKSTSTFGLFTFISRILGYIRDFLLAINLGSGPMTDAFFVAFRIPNTFRRLFSEGTFNAAFVPSYSSELTSSKKGASLFANKIFNLLIITLLALTIVIEIFMPLFLYIIAPGFIENKDKLDLTVLLTRITFPFLIFVSLASFFSAILNSHNKFSAAAAAPIILNIVLIFLLYFVQNENEKLVVYLSYGVSISGLIQLIFLYYFVKKYFVPRIKISFNVSKKIKIFFKKLLPSIFSSGVTQINILVGTIIASFQANAVSYLYYADRIYQINLAVAGIAIGVIMLPNLSKHIKSQNQKKISLIQNKSIEFSFFLSLPAMLALLVGSEKIVSCLFGYGSFDEESIKNSSLALYYFAYGLPAFAIIKIFSTFLFARHNTKIPFYYSLYCVALNIVISIYYFNKVGFIIIPIATSISSWVNVLLLYFYINKKNYYKITMPEIFSIVRIFCASSISIYIFFLMINNFSSYLSNDSNYKLAALIIMVFTTFFLYILISIVTKTFKSSDIKLKY